jgi:hypothetical protein
LKRPLEVLLRDGEMKVRRGVTVQLRLRGEVQYAVTDLDGIARFRVPDRATQKTVVIVVEQIVSQHELRGPDGLVSRIEITQSPR